MQINKSSKSRQRAVTTIKLEESPWWLKAIVLLLATHVETRVDAFKNCIIVKRTYHFMGNTYIWTRRKQP